MREVGLPTEAREVQLRATRFGGQPSRGLRERRLEAASADDLREFARSNLAHFKVPRAFHFVDALPKTATGKIQKYVLRGGSTAIVRQ